MASSIALTLGLGEDLPTIFCPSDSRVFKSKRTLYLYIQYNLLLDRIVIQMFVIGIICRLGRRSFTDNSRTGAIRRFSWKSLKWSTRVRIIPRVHRSVIKLSSRLEMSARSGIEER